MALVKCKECKHEISKKAKKCPNCGSPIKRTSVFTWIVGIFFAVIVGSMVLNGNTPQRKLTPQETKNNKENSMRFTVSRLGAQQLKKIMRNPDSFKLTSAFVVDKTNAVCYEYRSQNGFGGMSSGEAVLFSDKKKFLTSDMDGFNVLFNKECANKKGYEMVKSITWSSL